MKYENPSDSYAYFDLLLESSIKKKNKFDIYFYDSRYSYKYARYFLDMSKYLPKEIIELYDPRVIKEICMFGDQLVGLPVGLYYGSLYSNKYLLNKYKKPIPKTWNELIDICKYIMEKEKDSNSKLICYNGLFDDSDQGLFSLYSFIYSCRDSFNSTFPKPSDQSFINSLEMLRKLKNEIASDEIFSSNENFTFNKLMIGDDSIFLSYWIIGSPLFKKFCTPKFNLSRLPGLKEGISGSYIRGTNIGIPIGLEEDRKNAAIEVYKYISSLDFQRKMFANETIISGVSELLNDKEICSSYDICDIVKEIEFTGEPDFVKTKKDYAKRYQKYIYKYLYENYTMEETLKQIFDISKFYSVSINSMDTYAGLIYFVVFILLSVLMLTSLVFLFRENFNPFFLFLPTDFWILTILGSILLLSIPLTNLGRVTAFKCHLKIFMMTIGISLSISPTLFKLIIQFPETNKLSSWIKKHRCVFIISKLLLDILVYSASLIKPYSAKPIYVEDGESFEICDYKGGYSVIVIVIYKFLILLLLVLLIFSEWNISATLYNMRFIVSALYIDILSVILVYIFHLISVKQYVQYFLIQVVVPIFISVSNYTCLYGFLLLLAFFRKQNIKVQFIKRINDQFINYETQLARSISTNSNNKNSSYYAGEKSEDNSENNKNSTSEHNSSTQKSNLLTKIIDYHYAKESIQIDTLMISNNCD